MYRVVWSTSIFPCGGTANRKGPRMLPTDTTVEDFLERLSDVENYPEESLAPYEEFGVGANTYYFTPGGFLYRRDPGTKEVGGYFCGYLTDEVWHYRTDNS
jgi:hypothetical protein